MENLGLVWVGRREGGWVGWCCGTPECTIQNRISNSHKHTRLPVGPTLGWMSDDCAVCADLPSGTHTYRLEELAYARSGDKGDSANIGETCMDQVLPLSFSSEEQKQMQIIGFLRNLQILGKK